MQRKLILLLVILLFLGVMTAVGQAQIEPTVQPANKGLIVVERPPQQMIDGVVSPSEGANSRSAILTPLSLAAGEPSDICEDAPLLVVAPDRNDGGVANTRNYSEEASDPVLSCLWGNPSRKKGYRTMWYRLVAPVSGRVTLDTFNSRTDTVLAVYSGACDDLVVQHCNDDFNGFTSQVTVTVEEGQTYFVEIADWQPGVVPDPVMQLSALLEPVDSYWESVTSQPATQAISRHAVVAYGDNIYVIGGQTSVPNEDGVPQVSNRLMKFNTSDKSWATGDEQPNQIPGVGYSNTTAALVGSRIYLPTGYTGNDLRYDGLHWVYDIEQKFLGYSGLDPHSGSAGWADVCLGFGRCATIKQPLLFDRRHEQHPSSGPNGQCQCRNVRLFAGRRQLDQVKTDAGGAVCTYRGLD